MKTFDLEKALAGEPVVTRDGREVTQLHLFDVKNNYCLYGIVDKSITCWTNDGKHYNSQNEHNNDLFMKSKTVVKWVSIWPATQYCMIYDSEEKANKYESSPDLRLGNKAHRIEWEE